MGAVQMDIIAAAVAEEGQHPQEPEAREHQAMILLGLVEAQLFKVPQRAIAWEDVEQTEEKGQRLVRAQNLAAAAGVVDVLLLVLAPVAEVLYSERAAEVQVNVVLAAAVLEEHGVHIPQVAAGQKQLLEPHAVMVAVMVEEGQVMATLAQREARLVEEGEVAITQPIVMADWAGVVKSESLVGR